ncbi:hypothetical protein BSLG_005254 [Batrachochytrium salamandrivorans]|nr:hypothetical protein BSLG_010451 [Batrachochytrium salamandrivorans]KAJ1340117.1 hypothetical protein BSLG_005254 [Batrachochytrium salamandrivorans]
MSSIPLNGVGSFVPAICRLAIYYESPRIGAGGNSRVMVEFLKNRLISVAKARPYVEIKVIHHRGPPELRATYTNYTTRRISCDGLDLAHVQLKVNELCDGTGANGTGRKFAQPVKKGAGSQRDNIVPAWNPFHSKDIYRP